jgi:glycosyltransferase involved in cell wall biosynthesis/O-antigen/teichoic acid export membrane protein
LAQVKEKKLRLNLVIGLCYQFVTLAVNFVSKQAIRYELGTDYLGIQTVYGNICDVLIFAFSGIGIAMVYRLYEPFAQNDKGRIASVFQHFNIIYRKLTIGASAVGIVAIVLALWSINADVSSAEVVFTYLLYVASILIYNRYIVYYYFLMGDQRRYISCIIYGIMETLTVIVSVAVLMLFHNYAIFVLTILAKNIIVRVIMMIYCRKNYPCIYEPSEPLRPGETKQIGRDIRNLVISYMGGILLYSTDAVIISGMVGTSIAGCYSSYYFLFSGIVLIIDGLYESIFSRIGQLLQEKSRAGSFDVYINLLGINIIIVALCISAFYTLCDDFVTLWMGDEVLLPGAVIIVMSINLHMRLIQKNTGTFRLNAGLFAKVSWVDLLRGLLNVVLSLIMGVFFGLIGILVATSISTAITMFWYEPFKLYRYFGKSYKHEVIYQICAAVVVIASLLVSIEVAKLITANSWLMLIVKTCAVLLVAAVSSSVLVGIWYVVRISSARSKRKATDEFAQTEGEKFGFVHGSILEYKGECAISFVVPVYNDADRIANAVHSLCEHENFPFEIVIVNDGSTDATPSVCDELAREDNRVRVIHASHGGQGRARNIGIDNAKGTYIGFLDADDLSRPAGVEEILAYALEKDLDIVCGGYEINDGVQESHSIKDLREGSLDRSTRSGRKLFNELFSSNAFGYVWNKLYKRSFLELHGVRFTEEANVFMEDSLFNMKAYVLTNNTWFCRCSVVEHFAGKAFGTHAPKETLNEKVCNFIGEYVSFLRENEIYEQGKGLLTCMLLRLVSWSTYVDACVLQMPYEQAQAQMDTFLSDENIKELLADKENVHFINTVPFILQRNLYKFCFHLINEGKSSSFVKLCIMMRKPFSYYVDEALW